MPLEGVGAGVVERVLPRRVGGPPEQSLPRRVRQILCLNLRVGFQHLILRRLQHAVEASQHDDRQHYKAILRRTVRATETVGNLPYFGLEVFMLVQIHSDNSLVLSVILDSF